MIAEGNTVGMEFTLSLADGTVVDSNVDGDPLTYVHGEGQLLPELEAGLVGMAVDERKTINLEPAQAFGEVNPDAFREVPVDDIPEDSREVGAQLSAEGFEGSIRVSEIREETVMLDFNHPLAGQQLNFVVRVLTIE